MNTPPEAKGKLDAARQNLLLAIQQLGEAKAAGAEAAGTGAEAEAAGTGEIENLITRIQDITTKIDALKPPTAGGSRKRKSRRKSKRKSRRR